MSELRIIDMQTGEVLEAVPVQTMTAWHASRTWIVATDAAARWRRSHRVLVVLYDPERPGEYADALESHGVPA